MPSDRAYARLTMLLPDAAIRAGGKLTVWIYRASRG
jgi:hypothetical protein